MSWGLITQDWRLKLLAVGLAVLMLGAVAFSQNPPTTLTLTVGLNYSFAPNNSIVLINPPAKTNVTYTGLADVIKNVNSSNLIATVDATHASAGNAVRLNVSARFTGSGGVTVLTPAPIAVDIDTLQVKDLTVTVNAHAAPGWQISDAVALCPGKPCVVHFTGPASWERNLAASVTIPAAVNISTIDSPNQTIQLQNSNGFLDQTCRTQPCALLDVPSVSVHIDAQAGSTSSTVALIDQPPSHPPASGYRITAVTITPNTVTISGEAVALGKIRNIVLPALDLSGRSSDAVFQVAIPYPEGITGSVANATVKYSISANPNVGPSPGP